MLAGDESDWWQVVRDEHAGTIKQEVQAFVGENLRVGAGEIAMTASTVDTFDEYVKKSRGKTCTLCSRGVAAGGNLGPMKSSKSLTTLQSGFSNREMIGGTKRDNLLLCSTCRIEFSLRETAARRRSDGRLFSISSRTIFIHHSHGSSTHGLSTGLLVRTVFELVGLLRRSMILNRQLSLPR